MKILTGFRVLGLLAQLVEQRTFNPLPANATPIFSAASQHAEVTERQRTPGNAPFDTPCVDVEPVFRHTEATHAREAHAAAFDAFAKVALAYFENPSTELQAACEAAAFVVRTMQKVG